MEIEEQRKKFESWMSNMDDRLAVFLSGFEDPLKEQLDYSIDSVIALENWLLSTFANAQDLYNPKVSNFVDYLARYIGETIRRNIKGEWDIELSSPDHELYGMPIIVVGEKKEFVACPHALPTAVINRKKGNFLLALLAMLMDEWGSEE